MSTAAIDALAIKADQDTTYAKNDSDTQMGRCVDFNTVASNPYATIASLDIAQNSLIFGTTTGEQPILSGTTVKGIKGATGITLTSDSNVVAITGPDLTGKKIHWLLALQLGRSPSYQAQPFRAS